MADKVVFTKPAARRIANVVRQVEDIPPGRFGPSSPKLKKKEFVSIINRSGYNIPRGGVVWLREMENGYYSGYLVEYAGVTLVGLATDNIAIGEYGSVYVDGIHPILVEEADYNQYPLHFRLSVRAKSWCPALTWDWGKFLVVGREESPFLIVAIDGGYAHARRVG